MGNTGNIELNLARARKIIKLSQPNINYLFGELGYLLGQRQYIAVEIVLERHLQRKDPEEYYKLCIAALNQVDNQIKELLALQT